MATLRLSGPELLRLDKLLREAFKRPALTDLLLYRLDRSIDDYTSPEDPYPTAMRKLLVEANAQLWWRELLRAAREALPTDPDLHAFGDEYGLSPETLAVNKQGQATRVKGSALELQIKTAHSTYDILTWRKKLGEIENCVCRIELPAKQGIGTGFLVAPDLILTNYHVIESIVANAVLATQLVVRFDYKVLDDGLTINPGKAYRLAADWKADSSAYSVHDSEVPPQGEAAADELDYALVRLDGTPGADPIGGDTEDPNAVPRGWLALTASAHDFTADRAIYVVQHPDGKPMQIAIDADAVVGVASNGTRVRYTTTTLPGSSGAPCFSADWNLVALHHSGDPKYQKGLKPEFNQGIPVNAILQLLAARGKAALLGAGV